MSSNKFRVPPSAAAVDGVVAYLARVTQAATQLAIARGASVVTGADVRSCIASIALADAHGAAPHGESDELAGVVDRVTDSAAYAQFSRALGANPPAAPAASRS